MNKMLDFRLILSILYISAIKLLKQRENKMNEHLRQFFQDWVIKALTATIKGRVRVIGIDMTIEAVENLESDGIKQKTKTVKYNIDLMGVESWDSRVEITNTETEEQTVIHKHTDNIESL